LRRGYGLSANFSGSPADVAEEPEQQQKSEAKQ
jgi:hypothetical protein